MCGLFGLGLPLLGALSSCKEEKVKLDFGGKVIVIGAGAAGLTSGYLLKQAGIDFEILEASSNFGGRMKRNLDFADFPIPLGGEWLHVDTGIFQEIVNNSSVQVDIATQPYDKENDFGLLNGQVLTVEEVGFSIDQKFINSSWFDFFEEYIVPSIRTDISYNTIVESIDYSGDKVMVRTAGQEYSCDRVIVTAPLKVLQRGDIEFQPALPTQKLEAITEATVWGGCKAFIEFSKQFYPAFTAFDIQPETAGQKLYYDAAYGQNTNSHILGLFAVGVAAESYVNLSDADLIDFMLAELDALYNGQASAHYVKHIFQNWNDEPFIGGAYLNDHESWRRAGQLAESVAGKVLFAGEAYASKSDWGSVHAAARAAKRAVGNLVKL